MDDFDMGLLDDKTYMVSVLRQKMLGIAPVFMYRIKHEKTPDQDYLCVLDCFIMVLLDCNRFMQNLIHFYHFPSSADEWNLRKPLQECSLRIERRGDVLLVVFSFQKEGGKGSSLFALCKIDLVESHYPMDHYVKPVADSSRYFAVRVTDEKGGREAVIGLGFREREEAADFSQCLINYHNAIVRERISRGADMDQQ
jgi:Protein of unknown function (DUF1681)